MSVLSREDVKAQLNVVADIGGQFTGAESWAAMALLDKHDAAQRQRIAELEATNAEICKRAKVWQDEVDRLEAEREHAVRVMGDTVKQHATQGESLAAALKELNKARNMCPFSFGDLLCCLDRGHLGRHQDRTNVSAVAWTTEQSTTKELASLRLRVQEGENRLKWLAEKEYDLHTHREQSQLDEEYFIWWTVIDRRSKKALGHPLGSPEAAIDAAMASKEGK